jgi:hypothetical protein
MSNKKFIFSAVVAAALASLGGAAQAATQPVDLAGWVAADAFGEVTNTGVDIYLPTGAVVTGFTYSNLTFSTDSTGSNWLSDLVLSVNNTVPGVAKISDWTDWKPSAVFAPGTASGLSGSWNGSVGEPGSSVFGKGGPFTIVPGGSIFVTTYLDAAPTGGITISSGTLTINYDVAAVPEPSTYALMGLGLLGMAAIARRRRAD